MDVIECIKTRRSIRKFVEQPIEFDKLAKICEAGLFAPTAGNMQNFRFILVTEKGLIKSLYDHCLQQELFQSAQVCIVICGEDSKAERLYGLRGKRLYSIQNCAAAMQNMLLCAHALGLGGCWVGAFDEDKVRSMFGIEDHIRPQGIIALGYADEKPEPSRKVLTSFVHFNSYGAKVSDINLVLRDYSLKWQKHYDQVGEVSESLYKRAKKWVKNRKNKEKK